MKKILLFSIATISFATSQAQLNKGRVLLGGGIGYANSTNTSYLPSGSTSREAHTFNFFPSAGLFVRENTMVGLRLGLGGFRQVDNQNPLITNSGNAYFAGLFARRYKALGSGFYFFGNGALEYSYATQGGQDNSGASTGSIVSNSISAGVSPGVSYTLGKRFMLEAGLTDLFRISYGTVDFKDASGAVYTRDKGFLAVAFAGGTIPLNIGFNILLGK